MAETSYDRNPYPSFPLPETLPAAVAMPAAMLGLRYAKVETARVLEIGCGEGSNLIGMAVAYPKGRFVGFDLAATAVQVGQEKIAALGLKNIELMPLDILDAGPELGQFDYIMAHGVYAWVPKPVQQGLLRLMKQCLAPEGLGFVSYNALPACHMRVMLREMVLFHLEGVTDPVARIAKARELLQLIVDHPPGGDLTTTDVQAFARHMLERHPGVLLHDELGDIYDPQYLHQFVGACERNGLTLVGESDGLWWRDALFPTPTAEKIRKNFSADPLAWRQYVEFINLKVFSESVITHADREIDHTPDFRRVRDLWITSKITCEEEAPDLISNAEVEFVLDETTKLKLDEPIIKQAMFKLARAVGGVIAVADLPDDPALDRVILQLFCARHLAFTVSPPPFATAPGERPLASPLVRLDVERGAASVISLKHQMVQLGDGPSRAFIGLLDGTRTRADLQREMTQILNGVPVAAAELETKLNDLAGLGLLVE